MKKIVHHARTIGGAVAGAVRRAVDPPLTADARPIDIKRAIVEAVERRLEPAGGGRHVLPGDAVQVKVLAERADQRKALEAVLGDLPDAIRSRLLEVRCSVPRQFAVDVSYVRRAPEEWEQEQRLSVVVNGFEADRRVRPGEDDARRSAGPGTVLSIDVMRGQAVRKHLSFGEVTVRIGRSSDPTDDRGRPRVNDVAFLENDSVENRTVTRGHAVIRFDPHRREYRLFDEGSANGTRVVRGGEVIEVFRRDPMGVALRSGDEVQLGKAALRIRIE